MGFVSHLAEALDEPDKAGSRVPGVSYGAGDQEIKATRQQDTTSEQPAGKLQNYYRNDYKQASE